MSESLTRILDAWACRAVAASFFLVGLYRRLEDEVQASRALRAAEAPLERVQRLGLGGAVQVRLHGLRAVASEEEAEQAAWRGMVTALGGLSAIFAMAEPGRRNGQFSGLRGQQNAIRKGLAEALKGFRTAFPEEMTGQDIESALDEIADSVAGVVIEAAAEDVDGASRADLRAHVRATLVEGMAHAS